MGHDSHPLLTTNCPTFQGWCAVYMTPERFRTFGTGVDLDAIEDVALRSHLSVASSMVDSYCAVPLHPQRHDFRGGSITREEHPWKLGDRRVDWGTQRVYPIHYPIKAISEFRVWVTNTQYAEFGTDDLFINNMAGWVEVVSLTNSQIGLFGAGVLPVLGLTEPLARVSYTYGWEFPIEGEQLEATDAFTYRAQHQFWVDESWTIQVDGVDAVDFTVNADEGTVTFDEAQTADALVTASYSHKLPGEIEQATGLIAASLLDEQDLRAKGMGRLEAMQVEEVSLRRSLPQRAQLHASSLPDVATELLDPFVFRSVR